jgi:putative restriction endonuclease
MVRRLLASARVSGENRFVTGEVERDDELRHACFLALDVLQAKFGVDIPHAALLEGFIFEDRRVPFLNRGYGIYRASVQRGPAALSVNSSPRQERYQDEQTPDGVLYRYQGTDPDNRFNRSLRAAGDLGVPLVYFFGTRPNYYVPFYPAYVEDDFRADLTVHLTFGTMGGSYGREPVHIDDQIEKRYVARVVKQRMHQGRFRGVVLPAYNERCAICRLKEVRLLDAAHIVGDADEFGEPEVSNGLSLCSIHHRAFDRDLVGVAPDLRVHVHRRLLDDEDGPMLDLLKAFDGASIAVPTSKKLRPDPERLAVRFERFGAAT